jgi:ADP-dependent NAD(P)H-hydrate dehydratase / NAD(P)H-hydrate epimerase
MEAWLRPLYDAAGMRAIDSWAIEDQGTPSLELMEAAGGAVAEAAREIAGGRIARAVCGKGNNGGDGLVAARHLADTGFEVEAVLPWPADELSPDAEANLARFRGRVVQVGADHVADALADSSVVVDAIFGTGFSGAPRGPADAVIEAINSCAAPVVSADMPSGVDASSGEADGVAVRADLTVGFHADKLGQWVRPGKALTGELRVVEIGIPAGSPSDPVAGLIGDGVIAEAPRRGAGSNKFDSGEVVVVGGSRGLTGAVCMASEAAIRAGAGYATVVVPSDLEPIFEIKLTEVMSRGFTGAQGRLASGSATAILEATDRAAAVVLGPGLGRDEDSLELARVVARDVRSPLLLDADGLNAHAERLDLLADRAAPTVLTPHAGELGRLLGTDSSQVDSHRLASARRAAELSGAIVVVKGDDTIVAEGGRIAVSAGGAPALATAGTGDVLSGTLGALLARGMEPFAAACAAVHVHQRAGRIAAERVGAIESVVATDVIAALPAALAA